MKHGVTQALMAVANRMRTFAQTHTCCLDTGIDAALVVLAGFVLDKCEHDAQAAAVELERIAAIAAAQVRTGDLTMAKDPHAAAKNIRQ